MPTDLPEPVVPAIKRCGMRDEIDDDRLAADILAERERQPRIGLLEVFGLDQLAQHHDLACVVRELDADGITAGHHGHARGDRAHRPGDVVGKTDDAR